MHIGLTVGLELDGPRTLDDIVEEVIAARDAGFDRVWSAQLLNWDALTMLAVVGARVPDVGLGTAVVPTYPRHPLTLASQALTVQAATDNRLTLGIGVSHQVLVDGVFGYSFDRPARHLREYLSALVPLIHGQSVEYEGETLKAVGGVSVAGATPTPLLIAALGPAMLRLAGELADGTIVTWTGPKTLADHVIPRITAAAHAAERGDPRVVVSLPISVTADGDGARRHIAEAFGRAEDLPSYRAVLDLEGGVGVADVTIAGDEAAVERQLARLRDAGATEFIAVPFGSGDDKARTIELLAALSTPATR